MDERELQLMKTLLSLLVFATAASVGTGNETDQSAGSFKSGGQPLHHNRTPVYQSVILSADESTAVNLQNPDETAVPTARTRLQTKLPPISSSSWTWIGPAPITNGQTIGRSDPVSGRVTAIAVHPTNSNIVYAGTAGGGVYRS